MRDIVIMTLAAALSAAWVYLMFCFVTMQWLWVVEASLLTRLVAAAIWTGLFALGWSMLKINDMDEDGDEE